MSDRPDLVREMALAGCTGVFIGFETLDPRNLHSANKRSPNPQDFGRRIRLFHDLGIQVNGSFVLGFGHDGPEVFEELVDWIEQQHLACASCTCGAACPAPPRPNPAARDRRRSTPACLARLA